jgi:hypothetical protein
MQISKGRSAAKAQWEADQCRKHFGYRLKGKAGSNRTVPTPSVKSLAAGFYGLKWRYAPVSTCLKRFGHRYDDKCWWCRSGGRATQTWEHLCRHCSWWKEEQ